MLREAPEKFLPAARQPQESLRLRSFTALGAHRGLFVAPEKPVEVDKLTRLKREMYDVRGRGGKGIGYAYDDCR